MRAVIGDFAIEQWMTSIACTYVSGLQKRRKKMPIISFKNQFVPLIQGGKKVTTIRSRVKPILAGEKMFMYTSMRTKKCRPIVISRSKRVKHFDSEKPNVVACCMSLPIELDFSREMVPVYIAKFDKKKKAHISKKVLSMMEGFDSIEQMEGFFVGTGAICPKKRTAASPNREYRLITWDKDIALILGDLWYGFEKDVNVDIERAMKWRLM